MNIGHNPLLITAKVAADFGASVRSYFLHPYKMVKDARTAFESSQALDVLDGDIGDFLDASLRHRAAITAARNLEMTAAD